MPECAADRVLILAPVGRDGMASAELLRKAGLAAATCGSLEDLVEALQEGAAALFAAEEALFGRDLEPLEDWVRGQPAWSDLPVVVLTSHHQDPRVAAWRQELVASRSSCSKVWAETLGQHKRERGEGVATRKGCHAPKHGASVVSNLSVPTKLYPSRL